MAGLRVTWSDIEAFERIEKMLRNLSSQHDMANAARRAINRSGDMAKTQVIRALTEQTGLKRRVIANAIKVKRANYDSLQYVMTTVGGDVALKHFRPRETRRGVSANPFGERRIFPGSFLKAGRFPKRVEVPRFRGHVFAREGIKRFPIEKQKSGVIIPAEMVKGDTADVFRRTVATNLPRRVEHEIKRLSGGIAS